MPEITDAERAEYDQLKALAAVQANRPPTGSDEVDVEQLQPSRALLADGSTHDYRGAHPSHVDNGTGRIPVMAVYNL